MIKVDIHADDYAYSINTSKDMLECMRKGALDSFSIICNTKWFDQSMEMLYKEIPSFPFLPFISVHLNIPEGTNEGSIFPMSWGELFMASYSFKRKEVKKELKIALKTQINKTQAAIERCISIAKENGVEFHQNGVRLDSHIHTHLIPVVWESLTEVIEEEKYRIEYIRNPKEPLFPFVKAVSLWPSYSTINIIKNRILMLYSRKVDKYCEENKIDKMYMWGLMMSGHMDYERIEKLFPDMLKTADSHGRSLELLFHPGQATEDEYSEEMGKTYFTEANTSDNRHIEKDAVLRIKEITRKEDRNVR